MKEETEFKPKPLVLVGGKPILWHIMKIYAHYGFNEFILALGYKGDMIRDYFLNHRVLSSNFTLNTKTGEINFHDRDHDDFSITFAETGLNTLTGERVRMLKKYIDEDDFMVTYGDGVADINIKELVDFHKKQGTMATITGVKPAARFGFLNINYTEKKVKDFYQHKVTNFNELGEDVSRGHINGGFMVFKPQVIDIIPAGAMIESVFAPLAEKKELSVYMHQGKWKCMDTYKEAQEMNDCWNKDPFWRVWES